MKKKVTSQDIADKLGISRNTVSKALNNHPNISEKTKKIIIERALDMGYKKLKYPLMMSEGANLKRTGNIVAVTHENFMDTSYWGIVSRGMVDALSEAGYNLIFNYVKATDEEKLIMPKCVTREAVDGIIILGALQAIYVQSLLQIGLPTVFIDAALELPGTQYSRDTVLMENIESVARITRFLIDKGHTKLGFVGDIRSCKSFYERWMGFQKAIADANLTVDKKWSVIEPTAHHYQLSDELYEHMHKLTELPTAFVCANDRIAIFVIKALKDRGLRVPDDVAVAGFDDIFEAMIVEPHLTTVKIHKEEVGRRAVEQLLWRFKNPQRPVEMVSITTETVFRESIG